MLGLLDRDGEMVGSQTGTNCKITGEEKNEDKREINHKENAPADLEELVSERQVKGRLCFV